MSHVKLLDHGYVELIEVWGSDERIVEAARMSTDKGFQGWGPVHAEDCLARWNFIKEREQTPCTCTPKAGDEKLLAYLYKHKHMTPFEMGGAIFEVKAPIMVFREWHRHRTQGYNEMSARYVPLPNENYLPELEDLKARAQIAAATANRQAASAGVVVDLDQMGAWLGRLASYYDLGQVLYEDGLKIGVPKELARLPTTVGRYSKMRATANLRNWMQFLELRAAPQAQKEIRLFAEQVLLLLREKFPRTMELFSALR